MESGILEYLAANTGCMYLTDLRRASWYIPARLIERLRANDYTLFEWQDVVEYLTECRRTFQTQEEAKAYLVQHFTKQNKR